MFATRAAFDAAIAAQQPSAALLPCPFCGGAAVWHAGSDNDYWAGATCKSCGVELCEQEAGCMERAAEAWNSRASRPGVVAWVADHPQGGLAFRIPRNAATLIVESDEPLKWPETALRADTDAELIAAATAVNDTLQEESLWSQIPEVVRLNAAINSR